MVQKLDEKLKNMFRDGNLTGSVLNTVKSCYMPISFLIFQRFCLTGALEPSGPHAHVILAILSQLIT